MPPETKRRGTEKNTGSNEQTEKRRSGRVLVGDPFPDGIEVVDESPTSPADKTKTYVIAGFSGVFATLLLALSIYAMGTSDQAMINRVFDIVVAGIYGALVWAGIKALRK